MPPIYGYRRLILALLGFGPLLGLGAAVVTSEDPTVTPTVFVLAGDSTVTDRSGWGAGFAELLASPARCSNLAKGGRSSRSYRAEGWWQQCLDLKPDYLLIQFGHNDQPGKGPARESDPEGAFREHLRQYVDEARAAGIQPILVTSLTRRRWTADDKIEPTLAPYAEATSVVANERQVPLIDLHAASIRQCEQMGPSAFRALEPMTADGADHTHLNRDGGRAVAALVVQSMIEALPELRPCFDLDRVESYTIAPAGAAELTSGPLSLREDDAGITLLSHGKTVLVYNKRSPPVPQGMNPIYERSGFLHPVMSPSGQIVTATFPEDHPHQHGIFAAWVKTSWNQRDIDFWNLAGGTGRVLHQRVVATSATDHGLSFEVDLIHRAEASPVVDILRERWKVTAIATNGSYHAFDLETTQQNQTEIPLIVQEYHYGGMAVRGPVDWLSSKDKDATPGDVHAGDPCSFLNSLGSDRMGGNHQRAKWVAMTGETTAGTATIAVLCHADNFRAPQTTRLHPTKPYFVFSPCVDGEFTIDRQHPYRGRYRYLVTDAAADPQWLDEQWNAWCGEP